MPHFETVAATASYRDRCEDRVAAFHTDDRTVIAVADGAGGVGSGDVAAEAVIREVEEHYQRIETADQWADLVRQIDCRIPLGESTAVVVDLRPDGVRGASVGDSQAWIIGAGEIDDLTRNQKRKPLLGACSAVPVAFARAALDGVLLVATDGFFDYAKRDAIPPLVAQTDFHALPRTCIELVRLPSGELWDDVGIVVAKIQPRRRARKRYSI